MAHCSMREKLYEEAQEVLQKIRTCTQTQIEAVQERDQGKLMAADKQLEMLVGEKERTFGALRQHIEEHQC